MRMRAMIPALAAAGLALLAACQSTATTSDAHLHVGVDRYHMDASTQSEEAQRWFDQGLQLCYGFHHAEAIRSFRKAIEIDPEFAFAWWGVAYTSGPNINDPFIAPDRHARAWEASRKALDLIDHASPEEAAIIRAMAKRYASPMPDDVTPLNEAYADAMRGVYQRYPDDPDIATICADALMNLQPWAYWTGDDEPRGNIEEILAALESAFEIESDHPGANHLYIHAQEAGPNPEEALRSAKVLEDRIPGSGHLVHMPSHIYAVLGMWKESAIANEKAIAADLATLSNMSESDFYWGYYAHNLHFLAYSAMMECRYDTAMRASRQLWTALPKEYVEQWRNFIEGIIPTKYHVQIRFGRWEDILEEPRPPRHLLVSQAVHHYARSIAYSALGQTDPAREELERFEVAADRIPDDWMQFNNKISDILPIARNMVRAELAFREGSHDEAFALLREAAAAEDALVYDEPPGWMIPVRHALGALLMSAGRFEEAEAAYREDLERNPENGWSLLGLEQALTAQGATEKEVSDLVRRRNIAWARADVHPTSSCFCEPGRTFR